MASEHLSIEVLVHYLSGPDLTEAQTQHVIGCPTCAKRLRDLGQTEMGLRDRWWRKEEIREKLEFLDQ